MIEALKKLGLTEEHAGLVETNLADLIKDRYVPLHRLNEVNAELATAKANADKFEKDLKAIKDSGEDVEALKNKITTLQTEITDTKKSNAKDIEDLKKDNIIKLALAGKVHNADVTIGLIKRDEVILDKDGNLKSGLNEQIEDLKKSNAYLFLPEADGDKGTSSNQKAGVVPQGAKPLDGKSADPGKQPSFEETFAKNLASNKNGGSVAQASDYYFGTNKNEGGN